MSLDAVPLFFSILDECPITVADYSAFEFNIFADTPASSASQFVVVVNFFMIKKFIHNAMLVYSYSVVCVLCYILFKDAGKYNCLAVRNRICERQKMNGSFERSFKK